MIDHGSVWLIVGEPPRTVEHGEAAVRVFVNAHGRLDEVAAGGLLGDRQHPTRGAHRVVVPHHALILHAQDVVERSNERHKGRSLLGGRDRETGVVGGDVDGGEQRLAASIEASPSWRISGGSRLWSVPNSRS